MNIQMPKFNIQMPKVQIKVPKKVTDSAKGKAQKASKKKNFRIYYSYVTKNGETHTGFVDIQAYTKEQAQAYFVNGKQKQLQRRASIVQIRSIAEAPRIRLKKMSNIELANFCNQFAAMLDAGLTYTQIFDAFEQDVLIYAQTVRMLRGLINSGVRLSASMELMGVFPDILVRKIEAAEETGNISDAFSSMAEYLQSIQTLSGEILQAVMYPAIVLIFAIVAGFFYMGVVAPQMMDVYISNGLQMPALTLFLLSIFSFISHNMLWVILLLLLIALMVRYLITHNIRLGMIWEAFIFHVPLIGPMKKGQAMGDFVSTFAELYASGVPVDVALMDAEKTVRLVTLKEYVNNVIDNVQKGKRITDAFSEHAKRYSSVVDKMFLSFLRAGEQGDLAKQLKTYTELKANTLKIQTGTTLKALEPMITVFVLLMVAGMVFILYQPIVQMIPQMLQQTGM